LVIDGVLVVDKPSGMTSHDVVASARRALRESRIGHTGTLDPLATGVLPLAIGRATRLAQFLTASDKQYLATIQLGLTTDTYDVTGRELTRVAAAPARDAVLEALQALSGAYLQAPPPYSAKRVGGKRAYDLARAARPVQPPAVPVTVRRLELVALVGDTATVDVTCSAGFYVRSLAFDLGQRLGIGGCLQALRRTRSGEFALEDAVTVGVLSAEPAAAATHVLPMERLLPRLPAVTVTAEGEKRVSHGRVVEPAHVLEGIAPPAADWVRVIGPSGALLALARPGEPAGALHPSVVLM
jgi:tRNA pseudouridine55 synthase